MDTRNRDLLEMAHWFDLCAQGIVDPSTECILSQWADYAMLLREIVQERVDNGYTNMVE